MSHTARTLDAALKAMSGVLGEMVLCMVAKRGLSGEKVKRWQHKLRAAADCLEDLTK